MKLNIKPLSVNCAWQGRRFKTQDYKDYEEVMLWELKKYKEIKPKGNFGIVIKWDCKNASRTDIDNILKPFFDCLTKSGIIKDDRYCTELHIEKIKASHDRLEFTIYSLK